MEEDRYYLCHGSGTATRPKSAAKVVVKKGIVKALITTRPSLSNSFGARLREGIGYLLIEFDSWFII